MKSNQTYIRPQCHSDREDSRHLIKLISKNIGGWSPFLNPNRTHPRVWAIMGSNLILGVTKCEWLGSVVPPLDHSFLALFLNMTIFYWFFLHLIPTHQSLIHTFFPPTLCSWLQARSLQNNHRVREVWGKKPHQESLEDVSFWLKSIESVGSDLGSSWARMYERSGEKGKWLMRRDSTHFIYCSYSAPLVLISLSKPIGARGSPPLCK